MTFLCLCVLPTWLKLIPGIVKTVLIMCQVPLCFMWMISCNSKVWGRYYHFLGFWYSDLLRAPPLAWGKGRIWIHGLNSRTHTFILFIFLLPLRVKRIPTWLFSERATIKLDKETGMNKVARLICSEIAVFLQVSPVSRPKRPLPRYFTDSSPTAWCGLESHEKTGLMSSPFSLISDQSH